MSDEIKTTENDQPQQADAQDKKDLATQKQSQVSSVEALPTGELRGTTLDEQWRIACAFHKSGMLPKQYTTPEKVLVGMQFAYSLGLTPLMALRQISVINGQPSLWGELPLALVRRSGKLKYIREWLVDKDYKEINFENRNLDAQVFAALCELERDGGERRIYSFTQKDKHSLGVAAIWNQFEKIMMKRKARSIGLKDQFGDVLEGMYIAEYDFHVSPEGGDDLTVLTPQEEKNKKFKDKFKGETIDTEIAE